MAQQAGVRKCRKAWRECISKGTKQNSSSLEDAIRLASPAKMPFPTQYVSFPSYCAVLLHFVRWFYCSTPRTRTTLTPRHPLTFPTASPTDRRPFTNHMIYLVSGIISRCCKYILQSHKRTAKQAYLQLQQLQRCLKVARKGTRSTLFSLCSGLVKRYCTYLSGLAIENFTTCWEPGGSSGRVVAAPGVGTVFA